MSHIIICQCDGGEFHNYCAIQRYIRHVYVSNHFMMVLISLYSMQYTTSLPLYCIDTSVLLLQSIVSQLLLAVGCQSQCLTSGLLCESCWSGNCRAACKTATLDNVRVDILMRSFFKLRCASSKDLHPQLPSEVGCPLPIPNV